MIGDDLVVETEIACGVIAGPVFVGTFTALGARRAGYDWRRHAVSSLAVAREGWGQRANFILVGGLYCVAARGLVRSSSRVGEPAVVPALVCAAGVGLIGSGVFVTDPVAGFPPEHAAGTVGATAEVAPTRSGQLHNLCAIPIFVGLPAAALVDAGSAVRRREIRLGGVLRGNSDWHGERLQAVRSGVRWCAYARSTRRSLPAHVDRHRIRMAERALNPRLAPGESTLSTVTRLSQSCSGHN